jgi:hypothetical protein
MQMVDWFVQSHSVNGRPLRAVKIQLSCQPPSSVRVAPSEFRKIGSYQIPAKTRR